MRWDVTIGAWPAIWMMPVQGVLAEGEHGEIDNFEGQGGESDWFFGTIHDWQANGTITDRACHVLAPAGTDYAQYHTYGLLWTPGQITWYFDNQALGSVDTYPVFEAEDYYLILSMIEGSNWTYGSLTDVTASSIAMSVDWVRVWQQ